MSQLPWKRFKNREKIHKKLWGEETENVEGERRLHRKLGKDNETTLNLRVVNSPHRKQGLGGITASGRKNQRIYQG